MKSLLKFPLLVAVATMMSCSFSACSDNDDPTPDTGTSETDAKFEAIAKQYLDHTVYVTYKNLADETEQLVKDLQALKDLALHAAKGTIPADAQTNFTATDCTLPADNPF